MLVICSADVGSTDYFNKSRIFEWVEYNLVSVFEGTEAPPTPAVLRILFALRDLIGYASKISVSLRKSLTRLHLQLDSTWNHRAG